MARSAAQTRQRILDAAYGLFWRQGYVRASLDDIAERANITKRALYQHFRSKDDLIAAVLTHSSELAMERLHRIAERMPEHPEAMIDSFFGQLSEWAAKPRWSGTGFTRVVAELADLPGHPARVIARKHKATLEAWLADLLARGKVPSPEARARELTLLMEGAASLMLIHGDRSYAEAAAQAAKQLIKTKQ